VLGPPLSFLAKRPATCAILAARGQVAVVPARGGPGNATAARKLAVSRPEKIERPRLCPLFPHRGPRLAPPNSQDIDGRPHESRRTGEVLPALHGKAPLTGFHPAPASGACRPRRKKIRPLALGCLSPYFLARLCATATYRPRGAGNRPSRNESTASAPIDPGPAASGVPCHELTDRPAAVMLAALAAHDQGGLAQLPERNHPRGRSLARIGGRLVGAGDVEHGGSVAAGRPASRAPMRARPGCGRMKAHEPPQPGAPLRSRTGNAKAVRLAA
jgi:hypothetical protein